MRKLCIVLFALLLLAGCTSQQGAEPSPTPAESGTEIPQEVLSDIEGRLTDFLSEYGDVSIFAFDDGGALRTSFHADGMVLQVTFPDYANAMVVQSQELAAEHDLSISEVSVTFTAGEDNTMSWRTNDCSSGTLIDAYNGNELLLKSQSIADLVDRYGAMDWFYPLTSEE